MTAVDLPSIHAALAEFQLDGWLLYDFRGSNVLAQRVLGIHPESHTTRRFAYFIPSGRPPQKLVHRIEEGVLDHLPGEKIVYLGWQEWEQGLATVLAGAERVAMEYSPRSANPYVSRVDAGTVELVRSCGADVCSSGDLVQLFEATWDERQWEMHREAERLVGEGFQKAWRFIADEVERKGRVRETAVQAHIMRHFAEAGLTTDHPPIVAAGPHSGLPHYAPQPGSDAEFRRGDFVLIDAWAKLDQPDSVYADYTRVAFVGSEIPQKYADIFAVVAAARDAAIDRVRDAFARGETLQGWQVDDACRAVIERAGYGEHFLHRTGHNIGQETHGNGAHMDNLETHEERRVLPRTCFSIEPGIYLDEFGVRSEVNVFVDSAAKVHVTGEAQAEIRKLM